MVLDAVMLAAVATTGISATLYELGGYEGAIESRSQVHPVYPHRDAEQADIRKLKARALDAPMVSLSISKAL